MCEVVLKIQSCGCKGFEELRVAFGDMNNCQLKCPFCFTREQKPANDFLSNLSKKPLNNVKIIRFTGGEPLISQVQIDGIIRELFKIEDMKLPNLDLIVIQTNAIGIENRDIDGFQNLNLPILFEVSFKGTTIEEYRYLTFENPISEEKADNIFESQMRGYKHLVKSFENKKNISVLARLGIFHSGINRPMFKFVFPFDKNKLMFNPNNWDLRIHDLFQDQKRIWKDIFHGKIVIERLKTAADGSPGMGKRYRNVIEHLKLKNLLIEDPSKLPLPKIFKEKYYYKRGNEIYLAASYKIKRDSNR